MIARQSKAKTMDARLWAELAQLCGEMHQWLYGKRKMLSVARRHEARLESLLERLPANDMAILREEGFALLSELRQDTPNAIKHRKREIELTERLRASVQQSVAAGHYDAAMGSSILACRDAAGLRKRRAILETLEARLNALLSASLDRKRKRSASAGRRTIPRHVRSRANGRKNSA